MSQHRPFRLGSSRSTRPVASKRERAALHRSERARAHLERVRGGNKSGEKPSRSDGRSSRSRARPRAKLSVAAPVAIAVSLIAGAVFGTPIIAAARSWIAGEAIRLESLSVSGATRLSLSEIAVATSLPRGALIVEIEPGEVEDRLRAHPWISDAAVVRLPASRLLIRITERVAKAVVAAGDEPGKEAEWRVVSASGLPFASASDFDVETLPELVSPSAPFRISPDSPSEAFADAIALTERFAAFDLPTPQSVVVDDGEGFEGWVVRLAGLAPRVILGRENLDERLASLAEIIEVSPVELADAASIDLRFAKQAVLRSASPSKGAARAATTHGGVALSKPRPTG